MTFLSRLWGRAGREQAPAWGRGLTARQCRELLSLVAEELRSRGWPHFVDAESGIIFFPEDQAQLGLSNLAALCAQSPREQWHGRLLGLLGLVESRQRMGAKLASLEHRYTEAQPLLRIRLYPESHLRQPTPPLYRHLAPGLVASLVYDMPDFVAGVPPEHLARWGVAEEEPWLIAQENIRTLPGLRSENFEFHITGRGYTRFLVISSESFFTSAHALLYWHQYAEPLTSYGALFGLPTRQLALLHPIQDAAVGSALMEMLRASRALYREEPGAVSQRLYWRPGPPQQERLIPIQASPEHQELRPELPPEFSERVLQPLGVRLPSAD